jgi:hypothetical protein
MQWDRCTSCSRTRSVSERADVVRAQTEPLRCNAEAAVHDRQTERTACKRQQATSNVAACDVDMQHAACNNVQLTTCSMQHAAQRATCTLSAHTVRPDCVNGRSRNRQLELVRASAQRHLRRLKHRSRRCAPSVGVRACTHRSACANPCAHMCTVAHTVRAMAAVPLNGPSSLVIHASGESSR